MIISLEEAKAHLNVTDDADDAVISSIVADAEDFIGGYVDCPMTPEGAPNPVKRAVKMLVGTMYLNREAGLSDPESRASDGPVSVFDLIGPFRKWSF